MNKLILLLIIFGSSAAFAQADVLGQWSGVGSIDEASNEKASEARLGLRVEISGATLHIIECWSAGPQGGAHQGCATSDYDLEGDFEIWKGARKIGDIFPGEMRILIANGQVAEQLLVTKRTDSSVLYQYSYVNVDGASIHRKGLLSKGGP